MSAPIDKLKFRPVVHLEEAVPRERLTARILDALPGTARLTLVMAPAGFGKTTVLAQIAARLAQGAGRRVAWLNCGPQDREPGVFMEDLCRAWIEAGVVGVDAAMGAAELSHALAECAQPLTLFVDRYELASSAAVDALLGNLAVQLPRGVQCVVGSRVAPDLPLTTLQVEGHLRLIDVDPANWTGPAVPGEHRTGRRARQRRNLSTDSVDNSVGPAGGRPANPRQCWLSSDVLRDWAAGAQTFSRPQSAHETAFHARRSTRGSRA